MRIVRTSGPVDAKASEGQPGLVTETIKIGAGDNIHPVPGTGLLFEESEKQLKVSHVMPHMKDMLGEVDIAQGDVLLRINGTDIESYAQFSKIYEAIETGKVVTFIFKRGEKENTVTFAKPKAEGNIIIKKQ
jgi:PDZ domain-containing secreted protein